MVWSIEPKSAWLAGTFHHVASLMHSCHCFASYSQRGVPAGGERTHHCGTERLAPGLWHWHLLPGAPAGFVQASRAVDTLLS